MADTNIREIQVSAKQLVFLFMASVVLAVAVFLLGVSVGRGVRDRTGAPALATESAAGGSQGTAVGAMPPETQIPPTTLQYPELSKGDGSVGGSVSTSKADSAQTSPTTDVPDVQEPDGPAPAREAKAATPPPAPPKSEPAPKIAPKSELPAPPKPGSGWSLQIGAYRSRENADKQAAALKAKGYPATVSPIGGLFRVRVGSYPDRAEADRVAAKLKQEGFASSVSR
jgi:cell division protein FtsN